MEQNTQAKPRKKLVFPIILALVLIGALFFTIKEYVFLQSHEETDDAQVDGDISPVIARVSGYVQEIRFKDNQYVHAGDTLVILDDRDYQVRLQQAEAALSSTRSSVDVSEYQVSEARTNAALVVAQTQLPVQNTRVVTNQKQVGAAASNLASRQADIDFAKLQLTYTVITAPASGTISKRNIQIGQLVPAGSPLFSIVHDGLYITANFKETQMSDIKLNQKVDIKVDAFDKEIIPGTIESFSGATGAKFSLLPPDNATGNFVKVVQRVPIRIRFDADSSVIARMRPGMSVDVTVHTK
jgi:membrane fusion protein (multidrug efflux system)